MHDCIDHDFSGARVLVVDDIVKYGRSMGAAFSFLRVHGALDITGAARRMFDYDIRHNGLVKTGEFGPFQRFMPAET